jgi:hypothetical protein
LAGTNVIIKILGKHYISILSHYFFGGVKISNSNRALGIKEVIIIIATLFIGLPVSYLMWNDIGLGTLFIILVVAGILLGVVLLSFILR